MYLDVNSGTGWVLSMADDLNGDGRDDLFFTAPHQTPGDDLPVAGLACVVFGSDRLAGKKLSTYSVVREGLGLVVHGTRAYGLLGMSAAAGRDLNQDRFADIVLGSSTGEAYVLFGGPGLRPGAKIDLASLDGLNGLRLQRTALEGKSALLGLFSTSLGDMDGDGFADLALIVGSRDPLGNVLPGRAHLLLGPLQGADCNRNGIPDECDIASGTANDVNRNGVPDSCEPRRAFHRGDADQSGEMDLSDAISVLDYLFAGGGNPSCLESADAGNDGRIDISDVLSIVGFLFLGGAPPADPGPTTSPCGLDPDPRGSPGDLGCVEYLPCARPPR